MTHVLSNVPYRLSGVLFNEQVRRPRVGLENEAFEQDI